MPELVILYDGWSLAYQPAGPAALHLLTLLAYHPGEIQAKLALPASINIELPANIQANIQVMVEPVPGTGFGRVQWEQRLLPALATRSQAGLVHLTTPSPSLFGPVRSVISPTGFGGTPWIQGKDYYEQTGRHSSFAGRLREALAQGGMSRARGVLWPSDLPLPNLKQPVFPLPPVVNPAFYLPIETDKAFGLPAGGQPASPRGNGHGTGRQTESLMDQLSALDLPATYILYHGPGTRPALQYLLEAWTWAAASIGDYYPLLLLGLEAEERRELSEMLQGYPFHEAVRALPDLSLAQIVSLYQGCTALVHPAAVSPWGGSVRAALACAKPVVAYESAWADAMVGPAAYLVPPGGGAQAGSRALGAALITVVVEESVAEELSQAARLRSAQWGQAEFGERLAEAYRQLALR